MVFVPFKVWIDKGSNCLGLQYNGILSMNIFLGSIWILLGCGMLLYEPVTGNPGPGIKLGDSTLNAGWLALLLAGWNGARLWSSFSFQKHDQMRRYALMQRDRTRQSEERPINEEFRFDDNNNPPS